MMQRRGKPFESKDTPAGAPPPVTLWQRVSFDRKVSTTILILVMAVVVILYFIGEL
jgi:hypothetical protein